MDISKDDKKKLFSLFENIDNGPPSLNTNSESSILIVDALNLFIRAWSVSPYLNEDGVHTGGISGFLKSLGCAIKLFSPTRCIIVFDGEGGSQKRRQIYSEYKNKRRTKIRINRAYVDNVDDSVEDKNKLRQLLRVVRYLDCLPVTTLSVDNVEADDVIAYLSVDKFKNSNITVMSADKDFLQLASERIKIWSPTKKKLYGCAEIVGEYGISCENYINYRILEGDVSDNISGIKGAGLKTIKKCFPIFENHHRYSIDEICNYADSNKGKLKLYDTVLSERKTLERNYDLMQLNTTQMQPGTQLKINDIVDIKVPKLNRFEFSKLVTEDGIWNNIPNYQIWVGDVFNKLNNFVM
jgi:5'-3' exonuclease